MKTQSATAPAAAAVAVGATDDGAGLVVPLSVLLVLVFLVEAIYMLTCTSSNTTTKATCSNCGNAHFIFHLYKRVSCKSARIDQGKSEGKGGKGEVSGVEIKKRERIRERSRENVAKYEMDGID